MPYYGRQVARLKGVGKYINWNQGGGPKKAGLGPQINVSTWGRRVIARRTNNCCCDPIELTSVQMSIPSIRNQSIPSGSNDPGTISDDTPWNQWTPAGGENGGGGYVGPPRNDVSGGVINPVNQIYAIFTFNKPITASSPPYKYTPALPNGTSIEVIGLEQTDGTTPTPLGVPVKIIDKKTGENRIYKLVSKTTPVTQIPGGTEVRTFFETNKRLTDGSRFLIDHEIVDGSGALSKFDLNASKARLLPDMQSGLNNAQADFLILPNPLSYWDRGPPQKDISSYGAFNRRLDWEERGGFAPQRARTTLPLGATSFDFSNTNHFLGNIFGVYTKAGGQRALSPYNYSDWSNNTININPNLPALNLRLVQSNPAVGIAPNISCRVENYSADAAYISTGKVSWLDNQHALFINITSIMQIMLRNCTANAIPDASGGTYNTSPAGLGWLGLSYTTPVPDPSFGSNNNWFGDQGAPPMPKYFAGNPLSMLSRSVTAAGPAGAPGQVNRPPAAQPDGIPTDWQKSGYNVRGKYATWWKDSGLSHPGPRPLESAGPWQIGGIDGNINATYPLETKLPAWTDATWNQIGINHQLNGQTVMYNAVTLDSGGEYQQGPPAPGFETTCFEGHLIANTLRYSSYHILYYGHVVEKMRQLTYAGFGSYIVRDILSSKYDCGNDGFDGPVGDINIPSGDRRVTTTDDTSEAGLLTFASNVPLAAASSAATPALPPPTGNPSPPANPPSGPTGPTIPPGGGGGGILPPGGGVTPIGPIGGTIGGGL